MAEALLRHLGGGRVEAHSAGTEATLVRPLAIAAMREIVIDISAQRSKRIDEFLDREFDVVITVCDDAREACPLFPGAANQLHWPLPDPSAADGSQAHRMGVYRAVRDSLDRRVVDELLPMLGH